LRDSTKKINQKKNVAASFLVVLFAVLVLLSINGYLAYSAYVKIVRILPEKELQYHHETSSSIKAEIINGCGIEGLGDRLTDTLRANHVDVIQSGNYYQFNVDHTLILDRSGSYEKAKRIADILGLPEQQIIRQYNKSLFLDVTVLTGKDYSKLKDSKE